LFTESDTPEIQDILFYEYLLVSRRGHIMYYLVEFKTMTKHKQIFVHKPD